MNSQWKKAALAASILGGTLIAGPAFTQNGGTVARYTMDAGTISGMGAMAQGGMAAAMGLRRGGNAAAYELQLRLGSTRAATGDPRAEHTLPNGARFGPVLPLITPRPVAGSSASVDPKSYPTQMPKGRMLLFWGCGERAPAGQPVVIDFSKMAKGQVPPGLYAQALAIAEEWRIMQSNSRTYGEWPNERAEGSIPARASLIGAHKVAGNYSPTMNFTLDQDFMAPIALASKPTASGAVATSWNAVPAATGYFMQTMSSKNMASDGSATDMVWWSSSATRQFGGAMYDWLSPAAVSKYIAAKNVMPPSQTSCTIPAEVKQAGGDYLMAQMYAYGPERHFAYPPRPADPKMAWKPEWIARARFRSMTSTMLGMEMPGMAGMAGSGRSGDDDQASTPQQPSKPPCGRGLGAIAKRAAGLCQ